MIFIQRGTQILNKHNYTLKLAKTVLKKLSFWKLYKN